MNDSSASNKPDTFDLDSVTKEIKKQARSQIAKSTIIGLIAVLGFALMGWWFYLEPKLSGLFGGVPKGAVIAFSDLPTNATYGIPKCPDGWTESTSTRGRFIMGADPSLDYGHNNPTHYTAKGGQHEVPLSIGEMPEHGHGEVIVLRNGKEEDNYQTVGSGPAHLMLNSHQIKKTGENKAHNNMPPYVVLTFCKKT